MVTMGYGKPTVSSLCRYVVGVLALLPFSAAQYRWEEGSWSSCIKDGCGYGGMQTRDVWCVNTRTNQRESDDRCVYIPDAPPKIQTCKKPCNTATYEVMWGMSPWSDCKQEPGVKVCSRARGIQTRNVSCYYRGNDRKQDENMCSSFKPKPETRQPCRFPCPQDCIVGQFSEWSKCDECRSRNSTRTRNIVVAPENGGIQCPPFSEHRSCGNCSVTKFLKFSKWTDCTPFEDQTNPLQPTHPLIGMQERQFQCINMQGITEDLTECVGKFESVVKKQSCMLAQDCVVGEWTSWDLLNSSCKTEQGRVRKGLMRRTRTVTQLPLGNGRECDPLEEFSEVSSDTHRNCPRTQWIVSSWSKCKQVDGLQQCSMGLQQRKSICIEQNQDGEQKPVDDSKCAGKRPVTSQTCRADCHWDCTVSLWSPWSDCKVTDCDSYARKRRANKKTGQRYRTRKILTRPGKGGQPCPHLSETQNCDPEPCYIWNITTGPCNLYYSPGGERCGIGEARRLIGCVNRLGEAVSESLCAELREKPPTTIQCEVACDNACVLSDWGTWSECPDICQQDPGQVSGVVSRPYYTQQRTRTILARAPPGGRKCPPKRDLEDRRNCPTVIECATYMWHAAPWEKCDLDDPTQKCGRGTQKREVGCYNSKKQPVSDEKCTLKVRPQSTRSCDVPCPQDCILTEFSDWSECSATCVDDDAEKVHIPIKTRRRHVLVYPAYGGETCPDLLTEQEKCLDLIPCNKYRWVTSPWSDCVLPRETCGQGLRAREVTCESGTNATGIQRHFINVCLSHVGQMPLMSEACYVSCNDECVLTEWSEWSPCLNGCGTKRFRDRKLKDSRDPNNPLPAKCYDPHLYPTYEQDICHCKDLQHIFMGNWSDCVLEPPMENDGGGLLRPFMKINRGRRNATKPVVPGMGDTCGTGKKYRIVACTADNSLETVDKCTIADYREEVCTEPCPVDCQMSEWGPWSLCQSTCGAGVQNRTRHIERLPSKGGRQCPSMDSSSTEVQTRLCHPECKQHVWKTYDWSMCIPYNGDCGNGTQTRSVSCVIINANGYITGVESNTSKCDMEQPRSVRSCQQPCGGDCVVTEWSDWTVCRQPCDYKQLQRRSRKVMREALQGFKPCPSRLEETRPCTKGYNCVEYNWHQSDWTSCLVNNGLDDCGVGHKERYPICKSGKQTVDDRICTKVLGPFSLPLVMSCEIPCDVDCLLSPWSDWSSCSKSCGLGQMTRERFIVERHIGNGRECSDNLQQTKDCFDRGCYRWRVSDWSPCTPQPNLCGFGKQVRNITCLGDDGLPADPTKCEADMEILVLKAEQECHVPCPGECVMTQWSQWTECFIPYEDFIRGISRGMQSRSRAITAYSSNPKVPCPDQLWERRGCTNDKSTEFVWVASDWTGGTRTVQCERRTGTNIEIVTGGCDPSQMPPELLRCKQNCLDFGATCVDTDRCECSKGIPEYGANQLLLRCVENGTTLETAAIEAPTDETGNMWMYAVVAVATLFVIFVAIALYNMSEFLKKGPRVKDDPEKNETVEEGSQKADTITREKAAAAAGENCSVCNAIPAPVDTMVTTKNGRLETTTTDDVGPYVDAWEHKSFCRTLSGYFCASFPCMKHRYGMHVHGGLDDISTKDAYIDDLLINPAAANAYTPFQPLELDVQDDLQMLIHTPSYYLATRDKSDGENDSYQMDRNSKVLSLPLDQSEDVKCESIETTEYGGQSSYRSRDYAVRRCHSDSAISIPTTGSTSTSSYTNSPGGVSNSARRRSDFKHGNKPSKDSNSSGKHRSVKTDEISSAGAFDGREISGTEDTSSENKRGSMAMFMEDFFEKINSLPRDNSPKFKDYLRISAANDSHEDSSSTDDQNNSWNDRASFGEKVMSFPRQSSDIQQTMPEADDDDVTPVRTLNADMRTADPGKLSSATSVNNQDRSFTSSESETRLVRSDLPIRSRSTHSNQSTEDDDLKGYCYFVPVRRSSSSEPAAIAPEGQLDNSHFGGNFLSTPPKKPSRLTRQQKFDNGSADTKECHERNGNEKFSNGNYSGSSEPASEETPSNHGDEPINGGLENVGDDNSAGRSRNFSINHQSETLPSDADYQLMRKTTLV